MSVLSAVGSPDPAPATAYTPDAIRWFAPEAAPARALACPVCGDAGPHRALLAVTSMVPPHPELVFLRCAACGCGHYDPPGAADFAARGDEGASFWRYYVEVGGGLWETIWPVASVAAPGGSTLLDVGCGFGFAVDFWSQVRGAAVGVELAEYGRLGARMLGITVHDRRLRDCEALAGRRFDVVHASEVIEHVPDPVSFVDELAGHLADDGVLVLTTPSMEFIERENHSLLLHAALAPGYHGFLLSEPAFASIARRAGFAHVEVRRFGERQVLWASRAPLAVDPATPQIQRDYERYVDARLASLEPSSPVWQGYAYRAIKERAGAGRTGDVRRLAMRLVDAACASFGEDLRDPERLAGRLAGCEDLAALGRAMPYFMPGLHYHLAMIALRADRDAGRAERHFRASVAATLEAVRAGGAALFMDALATLWHSRAALGELAFVRGDVAAGVAEFCRIAREGDRSMPAHGYATASRQLVEMTVPTVISMLDERGQHGAARELLGAYRDHVRARYGEALLTADGVDRAMASGDAVPLDPLFAPATAAAFAWRDAPQDARPLSERVAAVARAWSDHPAAGGRMRHHDEAMRRRLGASVVAGWSTRYTFKG